MRRILAGISCGAVGLLVAVVAKMLVPLIKRRDVAGMLVMIAVFVAIGLLRWLLQAAVLLVTGPVSNRPHFFHAAAGSGMSQDSNPIC